MERSNMPTLRTTSDKQARLAKRLRALSETHRRYDYWRIADRLHQEKWTRTPTFNISG